MKYIITIFIFLSALSANAQFPLYGNKGWNVGAFNLFTIDGTDSLFTSNRVQLKSFKPIRPGYYTMATLPSAATVPGGIAIIPDSAYAPFYSDGSTWQRLAGSSSGSLPVKPANYFLKSQGAGVYDTTNAFYINPSTQNVGVGSTGSAQGMVLDTLHSFNSGITLHRFADQATNYFGARWYVSSSNTGVMDLITGGTQSATAPYYDYKIKGTTVATLDASQFNITANMFFTNDNTKDIGRLSGSPFRPRYIYVGSKIQVGTAVNTTIGAYVHIGAGANTANNAPLKFTPTASVLLITPEIGAVETFRNRLTYTDSTATRYILYAGGTPTIAAGSGAGTGPTVSITGIDQNGYISVTTGTTSGAAAAVVTVTFSSVYGAAPKTVIISPANAATAALTGTTQVFVDQSGITTGAFVITSGSAALTDATAYKWYYRVSQ